MQARFEFWRLLSWARVVIRNRAVVKRNFNVSLLKDEQKEVAVAILSTGFEESLIYQLYATAKEVQFVPMSFLLYHHLKAS